ncbi:MAG: WD40 repeat domain-containing protein, partial [Dehalococcoidia bacterium]
ARSLRGPVLMAFHPALPLLAVAGPNNTIRAVAIDNGSLSVGPSFATSNAVTSFVTSMEFLPATLASAPTLVTHAGASIAAWDVGSPQPSLLWEYDWRGKSEQIRAFAISRTGSIALALGSGDLEYHRLEDFAVRGATGEPAMSIPGVFPLGNAVSFAFSPDEVLLSLRTADGQVAVWNVETRERIGSSFASNGSVDAWITPGNGEIVVSADASTVVWDLDIAAWSDAACLAAGRNLTRAERQKYFPGRPYQVTCERWPPEPHT